MTTGHHTVFFFALAACNEVYDNVRVTGDAVVDFVVFTVGGLFAGRGFVTVKACCAPVSCCMVRNLGHCFVELWWSGLACL